MAKKIIDIGSSPNKGDGDPLRTAFEKINENFDELYAGNFADPENTAASIIPSQDGTYDIGSADKQWADLYVKDFIYLNNHRIELTNNGTLLIDGGPPAERQDTVGSVFADDSTVMVDGIAGKVVGPVDTTTVDATTITATTIIGDLTGNVTGNVSGNVTGDVLGSVFSDDSTLMIDGIAGSVNLDGTVKGDIIPDTDVAYDIGSATNRFRDLYLSGSTINLGGLEISNADGELQLGGVKIPTQTDLDSAISAPTGDLTGSVFADDSTLLVDSVAGKIVGIIENTAITTNTITGNSNLTLVGANGDTDGGTVVVVGGIGHGGDGGDITLAAGIGQEGVGGEVTVTGGIGSTDGGEITITGGIGSTSGGGLVSIRGGSGGTDGGNVTIYAGVGGSGNGVINIGTFNTSAVNIDNAVITGDLTGSVFADDSTTVVDGVNGNVTANILTSNTASNFNGTLSVVGVTRLYDDLIISGGDIVSDNSAYFFGNLECSNITNLQNNEFASDNLTLSAEGSIVLNGNVSLGTVGGSTDVYGEVEFNNGTTLFQAGNSVDFNTDVDFNDVVKFAKTTTTGDDDNPTLTLIDVNSSSVQVLTSNSTSTNNWELPDGSEGQIMHFVAGGSGGSGANHKIKINNWWKRDADTGGWSSVTGYWDVFAIYGFAGRTDTGMATAIFVDGAWKTSSPWVD